MVELKPGERRIDRTRPERHQLCGDPIVKNVVLGGILMPALEQDLAALAPRPTLLPGESFERSIHASGDPNRYRAKVCHRMAACG